MPYRPRSHARKIRRYDKVRPSASKRGYGSARWQAFRKLIIARDPICRMCKIRPTTDVDHRVPRDQGGEESEENCWGLCHMCHSSKTLCEVRGKR